LINKKIGGTIIPPASAPNKNLRIKILIDSNPPLIRGLGGCHP
jgi:hypothetical protein